MAPRRLFLSTVPADFSAERDLALGPWCFAGIEDRVEGWEALPFVDPFPTAESWVEADRLTRRLANQLVPRWAERLNARHRRDYRPGFWRVLVLKWLTMAIPPLWQRYCWVAAFAARHRDESLIVDMAEDDGAWPLAESARLTESLWQPACDFRLSSALVARQAPPAWRLARRAPPPWAPAAPGCQRTRAFRLPVNHVSGARVWRLLLSLWVHLLPRGPARDLFTFDDAAVFERFPPDFLAFLDEFLPRLLPDTLGGGFAALEKAAAALRYHPGRLLVDAMDSEDDGRRMVMAMAHHHGERLVGAQHGGIYGTARAMMPGAETEYRYHGFLTWGWTAQEDYQGRFVPVPAPELSRIAGRHRERDGRLLFIGGSMAVHGTRPGWLPKPQHYLGYRRAKLDFLGSLAPEARASVAYRPYRRNLQVLRDEDFVRARFPGLPLVDGPLDPALLACRLAVIDHPITTMLAALAGDVPTVLYWDPEAWPLARQAEPLFQGLRDAGILHHRAAAAAEQVNRV